VTDRVIQAIVIGASAGAIDALSVILPVLPKFFALPILVVVHLRPDRASGLVELFRRCCELEICEVEDKLPVRGGVVHFAPPDYHMLVEADGRLSLSVDEPVHFSRPSIDVLFETAAAAYGNRLVGVVLTGASGDGAKGLRSIVDAGGIALVQHCESAYAAAMPRAAIAACPEAQRMSLEQIASYLRDLGIH
jgi:two-component system, chemotaxis family, protein-glutamate methylesterase/glutaminase